MLKNETQDFIIEDLGVQEIDVYDIEVEDNHNFFGNDILVHNSIYVIFEEFVDKYYGDKYTNDEIVNKLEKISDEVIQPYIDKSYQRLADYMNAYEQKMKMKLEVISDISVFVQKKKYACSVLYNEGVKYDSPKLKATGLEMKKSSTPGVVRTLLENGLSTILYGTEKESQDFIQSCREKYMTRTPEEIAFPRGVNGLEKFTGNPIYSKGCPIHVRAALLFNHYLKKMNLDSSYESIKEGSKMKFIYLKMPNPYKENIFGFLDELPKEFDLTKYIDYDKMFEKSFIDSMKIIMEPIGWNTEEQSSLEDFFS